MNKIYHIGVISTISLAFNYGCSSPRVENKQPNLLYIFPDQYRLSALSLWSDPNFREHLSTQGDPVKTPNIDKLLKDGVIFTDAVSTHPVSSPHRAMMMSGMYPHNNGVENVNCFIGKEQGLYEDIECITDVLSKAGYQTAYVGKTHWHKTENLFTKEGTYVGTTQEPGGEVMNRYDTYIPEGKSRHSNEYWVQVLRDSHYNPFVYSNRPELIGGLKDGEQYHPNQFSSTYEADAVIKYLRNESGERVEDAPFSIIWSLNPPHPPYSKMIHCNEEIFNDYYKDMSLEELFVRDNVDLETLSEDKILSARIYFSLITAIDIEIGRVLDELEATGEADNTVVVFTSDHGELMSSHSMMQKNQIYDESYRVPFGIRYPKKIQPHFNDLMLGSVDIMPTILGVMGLEAMTPSSVEGCDYSALLIDQKSSEVTRPISSLYLRADQKGVRTERYTYLVKGESEYQLFDNFEDPYQLNSIRLESIDAEQVTLLKSELGRWLAEASDEWADKRLYSELIIYSM